MKKRLLTVLLASVMAVSLVACGGGEEKTSEETKKEETTEKEEKKEEPETKNVKFNIGNSGNVLISLAQEYGLFEEEGITIELVNATANADAMTMLATGKVDIVTNSGTSNPLQQVASGVDLTFFGGHMVNGCMPVIAKAGTTYNGPEDFIGKKLAINPSYFAFPGAMMDAGCENPLEESEWIVYTNYDDARAAVIRGEVDYALQGTGQTQVCKQMNESGELSLVCFQSDVMPNYSCCRMEARTEWFEKNPNTIKAILRVLIKAQAIYEEDKEAAVSIHAAKIGTDEDYVAAYMLDDHYTVSVDPLKNSIIRAWNILDETGFLKDEAKDINIEDHINTELYEEVLNELAEEDDGKNKDFYDRALKFFDENDK